MRRIVVCADDYALAPGVSKAIRALIEQGRLNATSVMTVVPGFATEAARAGHDRLAVPLRDRPARDAHRPVPSARRRTAAGEDGNFPPLAKFLNPLARLRIDRRTVEAEVGAQMRAFTDAFGRPPDFVDGHQHVQLLPGVREGFLAAVARFAPKAWVRQCGPTNWRALRLGRQQDAIYRRAQLWFPEQAPRARGCGSIPLSPAPMTSARMRTSPRSSPVFSTGFRRAVSSCATPASSTRN